MTLAPGVVPFLATDCATNGFSVLSTESKICPIRSVHLHWQNVNMTQNLAPLPSVV